MNRPVPVLRMCGVTKSFPTAGGCVDVLRGVDLTVNAGDFLIVTGPSGSGKTTLLNLAALLELPTSGAVYFGDRDVSRLSDTELCAIRKEEIGMVFQDFCLLPHRSAAENVAFRFRYSGRWGADAAARAEAALREMGLSSIRDRTARLLSAGEMQRVAIARAVALPPTLLVADEPTGNLDGAAGQTVMDCFRRLNRAGITILMVTHNETLLRFASRHCICRNGALADPG